MLARSGVWPQSRFIAVGDHAKDSDASAEATDYRVQVVLGPVRAGVRSRRHGDRRPERVREEQRGGRHRLGPGRTKREEPARRPDAGCHLQRQRGAQGHGGGGSAADAVGGDVGERAGGPRLVCRWRRCRTGDRARCRGDPPPLSIGRERVPDQRRRRAPAGRPRTADGHRPRREGLRDYRAGEDRTDPQYAAGRSSPTDRRSRRRHEVQGPPPRGGTQAGGVGAEPHAHRRHRLRGREAARGAQAAGRQGATLQAASRGAPAVGEGALRAALPGPGRRDRVGPHPSERAARRRGGGGRAPGGRRGHAGADPPRSGAGRSRGRRGARVGPRARAGDRSPAEPDQLQRAAAREPRRAERRDCRGAGRHRGQARAGARGPRRAARGGRAGGGGARAGGEHPRHGEWGLRGGVHRHAGARGRRRSEAPGGLSRADRDQLAPARHRQRLRRARARRGGAGQARGRTVGRRRRGRAPAGGSRGRPPATGDRPGAARAGARRG